MIKFLKLTYRFTGYRYIHNLLYSRIFFPVKSLYIHFPLPEIFSCCPSLS